MRYWILAAVAGLMSVDGPNVATAQTAPQNPFRLADALILDRQGNLDYVAPLRGLAAADKTTFDSDTYSQALETYNSFVGKLTPTIPIRSATPYGLAEVGPLLAVRARATSVVLINEAHNQPAHRAYCRQLLRQLAPLGYTIFAGEALSPSDTAINKRRFPLASSGFYTREPNMGKLLRAACASGFYVFSHEVSLAQDKEFSDWRRSSNYCDSMQAVNILAVLRKHPKAKIVVLVGYDHVLEKERDGIKRLATYLRELGHFDPFTIDQTLAYLPSHGTPATKPMALVTAKGRLATIGERQGYVDMQVIHPAVRLVRGRPHWLAAASPVRPVTARIPPPYAGKRCLAQLYDRAEYARYGEKAIPLDQYLTSPPQKQVHLFGFLSNRPVLIKYKPAGSI